MLTRVNGKTQSTISVHDRGFLYGHAVFETICVVNGKPSLLELHLQRLKAGAESLGIPCDATLGERLESECLEMAKQQSSAVLRVCLTIGEGGRGYQSPASPQVNRIVSLYAYPEVPEDNYTRGIHLGRSPLVLANQPALAGIKHANRLEQILARQSWQTDWQEAVLFDAEEKLIEATAANVFLRLGDSVLTPDLQCAGVAGVMRTHLLSRLKNLGYHCKLVSLSEADLLAADEVFVSNSIIGVWPVNKYKNQLFKNFSLSKNLLKDLRSNEIIPNH